MRFSIRKNPIFISILSLLISVYIRLVFFSTKWKWRWHPEFFDLLNNRQACLVAFWHNRLLLMACFAPHPSQLHAVISRHADGSLTAECLAKLGVKAIRGSSKKGAFGAMLGVREALAQGKTVVITPDGPRGPAEKIHGNIIALAREYNLPILPCSYDTKFGIKLPSWDSFLLSLPFGSGSFCAGAPIYVRAEESDDEAKARLEEALGNLTERTKEALKYAEPLLLIFYASCLRIFAPVIYLWLHYRRKKNKESNERFAERLGRASLPRPRGKLLWMHAASVGESLAILPLLENWLAHGEHPNFLVTSGTVTSANLLKQRLPAGVIHQFVPIDLPSAVQKFLEHWRPDILCLVESELWPILIRETARYAPIAVINGRLSPRAFAKWSRLGRMARAAVFPRLDVVLAQSNIDADRFSRLGAENVSLVGNLKWAAPPLPNNQELFTNIFEAWKGRIVWLAASTHAGEEEILLRVFAKLKILHPNLVLLIAPRHPARGEEILNLAKALGYNSCRRSEEKFPHAETEVFIADTIGELGTLYRLSQLVFMGGSLVPHGGQNPLEAARFACCLLQGPYTHNFIDIGSMLQSNNAVNVVADENGLLEKMEWLLQHPQERSEYAKSAEALTKSHDFLLVQYREALQNLLDEKK
jgi:3-deoxy-D-manno-octulosonic-acid transferase